MFSCDFCEISKTNFFCRTPPVPASVSGLKIIHFDMFLFCLSNWRQIWVHVNTVTWYFLYGLWFYNTNTFHTWARASVLIKITGWMKPSNLSKIETEAQAFSCQFCEIFKNNVFYRTPPVATSVISVLKIIPLDKF